MRISAGPVVAVCVALALGAGAFAAFGSRAPQPSQIGDPELREPWNSPAAEARARRMLQMNGRAYPMHLFADGLALGAQGRLVAATAGEPVNQLDVIDLQARTGWRLRHPTSRVGLVDPAISRDGRKLAFVVALPSAAGEFTGVSAVWVTDLRGKVLRVLSEPGRLYRNPAFSPDGERVAYFRDVFVPSRGAPALPPENQASKPMALFETSLVGGQETRLLRQAYAGAGRLNYAPDGEALFFSPGAPLKASPSPDGVLWLPSPEWFDATPGGRRPASVRLLRLDLRSGGEPVNVGATLTVAPGAEPGAFAGVAPEGPAIFVAEAADERFDWRLELATDGGRRRIGGASAKVYAGQPALSADGRSAVLAEFGAVDQQPKLPLDDPAYLVITPGSNTAPRRIARRDIRFAADPAMLPQDLPPVR